MEIRLARPEELPELLAIYETARRFMAANGNPTQWPAGYIRSDMLLADMEKQQLYVCADADGLQGVFLFAPGPDPTYAEIRAGSWPSDADYWVIHRVASAGRIKGLLACILDWAGAKAPVLRMDTHADNYPMQHLLTKLGFVRCGLITVEDGTERIAYQKG